MRVLVIGAGSIGRRHHDNLTTLGAVPKLLSWREAGFAGAAAAMDQAEAVVIATATDIRQRLIQFAADRGLEQQETGRRGDERGRGDHRSTSCGSGGSRPTDRR